MIHVQNEILRFLASKDAEVLCIHGKWGVGKTHAWNAYLSAAKALPNGIGLNRYAYVSLFGINSLDQLKHAIFQNTVNRSYIGEEPDIDTLISAFDLKTAGGAVTRTQKAVGELKSLMPAWKKSLDYIPFIKTYLQSTPSAAFLMVREQIVCFDDLERAGKSLDIRDVMGVASYLRDQKKCKVVFLLNIEPLETEQKSDFKKFLEKVVDISLLFAPKPYEAVRIAFPHDEYLSQKLATTCRELGITNIRTLKRIHRFSQMMALSPGSCSERIINQIIQTIALFTWSYLEPGNAPSKEYMRGKGNYYREILKKSDNLSPEELQWDPLFKSIRFNGLDDLDELIANGIEAGVFDSEAVQDKIKKLNEKYRIEGITGSFRHALNSFYDSFDDNALTLLDHAYDLFFKNCEYISVEELDWVLSVFKELGEVEKASAMLAHFMSVHSDNRAIFNLDRHPFRDRISDKDLIKNFNEKYMCLPNEKTPEEILDGISNGWDDEDFKILAALPVGRYAEIFKAAKGSKLHQLVQNSLKFENMEGAVTPDMRELSKRAREALEIIAGSSSVNAWRMKRFLRPKP
jgi:hypothetical protein